MFSGLREALCALFVCALPAQKGFFELCWVQNVLSMLMLATISICGCVLEDAGLVVGVVGAVCGSAIIYVIPCVIYAASIAKFFGRHTHLWLFTALLLLASFGVLLGVCGLVMSLKG